MDPQLPSASRIAPGLPVAQQLSTARRQPLPGLDVPLPEAQARSLELALGERDRRYRGRFAPSPTGVMHRGNLRTALLSWLQARRCGGEWLLRFDDLDTPRNRAGAEASIVNDLRWLGLDWDGPLLRQSERRGLYATVLSALRRSGALYPCRCSRRMLADVSAPHGALAVYPGFCRQRPGGWGPQQQRLPSWRLRLAAGDLRWQELSGAPGVLDGAASVGDVVLRRADGVVAYHLATAVDELWLGISEVVRGEDLLTSTGAQVAVMAALGVTPPRYGHVPIWCDQKGERLCKREASEGLATLRRDGRDAASVIGELAASVSLVPAGTRISASELLQSLPKEDPLLPSWPCNQLVKPVTAPSEGPGLQN
ncbi:MAG: tRNA glutamyl-Q(34) synthetase GluQRS [Synechococcus sp. ELA057]